MTRKEQAEISRQKLLDAASQLIREKGYTNVTIADITSAAGLSPARFYRYFKDKEDIFLHIDRQPTIDIINEIKNRKNMTVIECIRYYVTRWIDDAVNNYGAIFTYQWFVFYLNSNAKPNRIDNTISEINFCLNYGIKNGSLSPDTPLEKIARMIAFEMYGTMLYYTMNKGDFDAMKWADTYCDTIENSILQPYYICE